MGRKAWALSGIIVLFLILIGRMACAAGEKVKVKPNFGAESLFNTFEEAIQYANNNGGGRVDLLDDVEFFHPYFNNDRASQGYDAAVVPTIISTAINIIGNGHVIHFSPGVELQVTDGGALSLGTANGKDLLIFDGGGNWNTRNKEFYAANNKVIYATPFISVNGENSLVNMYDGTALQNRIYDGTVDGYTYNNAALAVCVKNNGSFNLLGGTIKELESDSSNDYLTKKNAQNLSPIMVYKDGIFNMSGGSIHHNSVKPMYVNYMDGWIEVYNWGPGSGGAMTLSSAKEVVISGGEIYNNIADTGGGISAVHCHNFTISGADIHHNTARKPDYDSNTELLNYYGVNSSAELVNEAFGWGGGLYLAQNTIVTLGSGTAIHDNQAEWGGGVFIGEIFWNYYYKWYPSWYKYKNTSLTMQNGSSIYNNIASYEGSDIDSMPYAQLALVDASAMDKTFRNTGFKIQGWFKDYDPRYDFDGDIDSFIVYTPEEAATKVLESGIELIAAPRTLTFKIIYDPNGGNGEMVPTEGNADESVHIASNKFSYPFSTFVEWNTKEDGTGTAYAPGDAYTMTSEDVTLYAQWKTPVTIEKIWDDDSDRDKIRPQTLDTHLLIGSERQPDLDQENTFTLREDPITHVWSTTVDLPAKDYSALWADEEEVPGYEQADCRRSVTSNGTLKFVFENRHEVSEFRVYKEWVGIDGEPPEISLHLYNKDVRLTDKPVMRDNWYIWKLPIADNDGNPEYYVLEEPMRGFMTEYLHNGELANCARNGDTIRNTLVPLTGERHPLVFWLTVLAAAGFGLMLCRRRK